MSSVQLDTYTFTKLLLQFHICVVYKYQTSEQLVNNFHERALRTVYNDHKSSCSEILITKNELIIMTQESV